MWLYLLTVVFIIFFSLRAYLYRCKLVIRVFLYLFQSGRKKLLEDPYKELFLWAVLNNLGEMAVCLWGHGKEALVKALVGRMLFEEMAISAEKEHIPDDIVDKIKANSK